MTRRSVSLSRGMWWAGLAAVVVALMPFTLRGHAKAEDDSNIYGFRHCSAKDMKTTGANCDDPKKCINACANKCTESQVQCNQCCSLFSVHPASYWACMDLCAWTWNPTPLP